MTSQHQNSSTRYWVGVASRNHVLKGLAGGFAQLCHGKQQPLQRMSTGDWIVYYSPQETLGSKSPCQRFTAIGEVTGERVYEFEMAPDFIPFRRDIRFSSAQEYAIQPLLNRLSFIKDKKHWGYVFRFGHLQIPETDFQTIKNAMTGLNIEDINHDH